MSKTLLQASGIHKSYRMGETDLQVLKGASLSVREGEILAVVGASGTGKSTLLHVLGALDACDAGTVVFDGRPLALGNAGECNRLRTHAFGFVFQFYHLLPELNVLENVLLPRMVRYSILQWWSGGRAESVEKAREVLAGMGLKERLTHKPTQLSGGQRQRVAIARALINEPRVLLADEPTGNLDVATGRGILDGLDVLNRAGQTIVLVTHDADVAARAHRTVRLHDGRIVTEK